nr:integrase, catalytic region, zinc finger, CCHC-type, peptidase aspartic, catalytic [Tanacetum cinerariifolium]
MIDKHDLCVLNSVAKPVKKTVASESNKKPRNNVRKLYESFGKIYKWSYIKFTPSGYMWKPKSPTGNVNPNVSLPIDNVSKTANVLKTKTSSVMIKKHDLRVPKFVAKPLRKPVASESIKKPRNNIRKLNEHFGKIYKWTYIKYAPSGYMWKPKSKQVNVNPNVSMPLGTASRTANVKDNMTYRCSKHMMGNLKLLINFVKKFMGTVKFGNDQIAPILGYGDLVQGAVTIKRVYYVEGLNHNLFSVEDPEEDPIEEEPLEESKKEA